MRQAGKLGTFGADGESLDVVRGGANGLTGGFSGFAALLGLLNGGAFDFVLGAVEFGFELFTGFFELAHAFAEAAGEHREFFQEMMRARLARNYYAKRRAILDQHPMYRRMELIVATSPEEFYFLVLRRFGRNIPRSVERFLAIFDELRESLPDE